MPHDPMVSTPDVRLYGDPPYGSSEVKVSFAVIFIVKSKAAVCGTPRTTNVPLTPELPSPVRPGERPVEDPEGGLCELATR